MKLLTKRSVPNGIRKRRLWAPRGGIGPHRTDGRADRHGKCRPDPRRCDAQWNEPEPDLELEGVVEPALARALVLAAEAGRWAIVEQIAGELKERRQRLCTQVRGDHRLNRAERDTHGAQPARRRPPRLSDELHRARVLAALEKQHLGKPVDIALRRVPVLSRRIVRQAI